MALQSNIPGQLKSFTLMYWAMALGQLIFGVVSYVLVSTGVLGAPDYSLAMTFQKIAVVFVPGMMAAGYFLFRYRLSQLDARQPLEVRLKRYFGLILVRAALFELAFLYCCVAAIVTRVQLFLWIAPVVFFVFLLLRPTPQGIASDLQLNPGDANKLLPGS